MGNNQNARKAARLFAVQALYQMDIAGSDLDDTIIQFRTHRFTDVEDIETENIDGDYFEKLVRGVFSEQDKIDRLIDNVLSQKWQLARLDSTLRAILRVAVQELLHTQERPVQITKQYTDMAHAFFEGAEGGMANAVLDKIAKQLHE